MREAEIRRIASEWHELRESIVRALDDSTLLSARRDEAAEAVPSPKFQVEEGRRADA